MITQNTAEWQQFRKNKIGASDAPIIMGVSPWCTPFQLWQRKLGLIDEQKQNKSMTRGHDLEEKARHKFYIDTGILVNSTLVINRDLPWMIASLDGMDSIGRNIVEIKCPGKEDHEMAKSGKIPDKYIPQIQHQLKCCDLNEGYYYSFDGKEGVVIKTYLDREYVNTLVEKEMEFYSCLINLNPPELSERDYINHIDNLDWKVHADNYKNHMVKANKYLDLANEAKNKLIEISCDHNSKGHGISVQKIYRKGNIDYQQIPEISNIDLEKYRKKSSFHWKININNC